MLEEGTCFKLPDLMAKWPWTRQLSPHYPTVHSENIAWAQGLAVFKDPKDMRIFHDINFSLSACLGWPKRDKDFLRGMTDLDCLFFTVDEYTDVATRDEATKMANILVDALRNPDVIRPEGEHILGKMTQEFWQRIVALLKPDPASIERFIKGMEDYMFGVVTETGDRQDGRIRSVEDYLVVRRETVGLKPILAFMQFGLGIPVEVLEHPILVSLSRSARDMILIDNDIGSYFFELSRDVADHNLVTVVMLEREIGLSEAVSYLEGCFEELREDFLSKMKQVPSWDEETNEKVDDYIDGLGQWVRGYNDWSFETKRYYGDDGLQVKEHRMVKVLIPDLGPVRKAHNSINCL